MNQNSITCSGCFAAVKLSKVGGVLLACALLGGAASAQTTAFTYQGRLNDGSALARGNYDFQFQLFGNSNAGPTLSATLAMTNVSVSDGLFGVSLDFGATPFTGQDVWLNVAVRTNSVGAYTNLTPRTRLGSTPYAIRAGSAGMAQTAASADTVAYQSVGAEGIRAIGAPGPGKVLLHNGAAWMWTNLSAAANGWLLNGNGGTTGSNFLGTTDAQPIVFGVNRERVLRLEAGTNGAPNIIGGSASNAVVGPGAIIAGGGSVTSPNFVRGSFGAVLGGADNSATNFAVVSGGEVNFAHGDHSFIGGGRFNWIVPGLDTHFGGTAPASSSFVGGGEQNEIHSVYSTVVGGSLNFIGLDAGDSFIGGGYLHSIATGGFFATIVGGSDNHVGPGAAFSFIGGGEENEIGSNATHAVVLGGFGNTASGPFSAVLGGFDNAASGRNSLAAGRGAGAAHDGTLVFADSSSPGRFSSTSSNQVVFRAAGGVGFGTNNPQAQVHVVGTNMADAFVGGRFHGDGSGLTNLTLPAVAVNPNTAYLTSNQTFTAANTFSGSVTATNAGNQLGGSGAGLTGLNAGNLATGTVPDTRISNNVARLNLPQTFTAVQNFAPGAGAPFAVGSSTKVTSLNADLLDGLDSTAFAVAAHPHDATNIVSGTLADARISNNVARLNLSQTFTGTQNFAPTSGAPFLVASSVRVTNFNADLLDGLDSSAFATTAHTHDASNIVTGTLADARLSTNVALRGASNVFTGSNFLSGPVIATNAANQLSGTFNGTHTGDGTALNFSNAISTTALQNNSITAAKIASGQVVKTLNGLTDALTLAAGANVTITPAGNTLTIASTGGGAASNAWLLTGNAGTSSSNNFIGTTDNTAIEVRVNNARAFRLEPNTNGAPNLIGGSSSNRVDPGVVGATIAGGGATNYFGVVPNSISANFGSIGGGRINSIQMNATEATIAGGVGNTIQSNALHAAIGGGQQNSVQTGASDSTLGGGFNNTIQAGALRATLAGGNGNTIQASASSSTISGGSANTVQTNTSTSVIAGGSSNTIQTNSAAGVISGGSGNIISNSVFFGAIPGGGANAVGGSYGFAAGRQAKAAHQGSFVWADSTAADFTSTTNNQVSLRANGGVRLVTGGAGATLDGQPILAGTLGSNQLPANVAYLNAGSQVFTGTNRFAGLAAGGSVGINTTNPASALEVVTGAGSVQFRNDGGVAPGINIVGAPASGVLRLRNSLEIFPNDAGTSAGSLNIRNTTGAATINLPATGTAYFNNGSVGIGTNAPVSLLHVNGEITASKFSGDGGGLSNVDAQFLRGLDPKAFWTLGGNSVGTSNSTIGTTNNHPLDVIANGTRALRLESVTTGLASGVVNLIGGSPSNAVTSGRFAAVIGGGGDSLSPNSVGQSYAGILGGRANQANGFASFIGGGESNKITGSHGMIPGGLSNTVIGTYSFAAGSRAEANHSGSFVWSDHSVSDEFSSSNANSFAVRCLGGARFVTYLNGKAEEGVKLNPGPGSTSWTTLSDRNAKKNFQPVDGKAVLERLVCVPVQQWNYKGEKDDAVPHIGPVAQDFKPAFYPGRDETGITTLEFDGVELAAIQGLNQKVEDGAREKERQLSELRKQNATLEERVAALESLVRKLAEAKSDR